MTRILFRAPSDPFAVHSVATTIERNLIATNAGNLVFLDAAWKLLSAPGVEITADRLAVGPADADRINERYDVYVIALANAFRNSYEPALARMTQLLRRLRIPVVVLGVGAQGTVDYDFGAIKPIERTVRAFMDAVLDRSPSIGVRGEGTRHYLEGLGYHDVDVIGCPSMFMWGDALRVERKVPALDEQSRVVITISPYRTAMGPMALDALARYPRLTYVAQDLGTLRLLADGTPLDGGTSDAALPVHPGHPFFREGRARAYIEPWSWIDDLRHADFVFGTRIHGGIASLLAGTPATVLAHDSRTLELARHFAIPHRLLRDVQGACDPAGCMRRPTSARCTRGTASGSRRSPGSSGGWAWTTRTPTTAPPQASSAGSRRRRSQAPSPARPRAASRIGPRRRRGSGCVRGGSPSGRAPGRSARACDCCSAERSARARAATFGGRRYSPRLCFAAIRAASARDVRSSSVSDGVSSASPAVMPTPVA